MTRWLLTIGLLCATACAATLTACASTESRAEERRTADVDRLASYLTGAFSSADQAAASPDDYFDIRLVCVPIWTDREDGPWLYIEQASASSPDRPYRQRVYQLGIGEDNVLRSRVYTLPGDAVTYAGWWRTPEKFDPLRAEDLFLREGCTVYLTREGEAFVGGTIGEGCASNLGEAAYATSEMTLLPDVLITWDRGWTADGQQAWGATEGGYVFDRVSMPE
ncbi:MAG: chromophore lyase CpcT/CpeT [Phycisphaerales bacterium]